MPQPDLKCKKILYLGLDPSRYNSVGDLTHLPIIKTLSRPLNEVAEIFNQKCVFTHVLFTSRTAAKIYFHYSLSSGIGLNILNLRRNIAIGRGTKQILEEMGLHVDFLADLECAEGIVQLFDTVFKEPPERLNLLFPRSAQGRALIPSYLEERKIQHTVADLYDTQPNFVTLPNLALFDEIVFTSPSTVHSFFKQLNQKKPPFDKCVAIGPVTSLALNKHFLKSSEPQH